VKRPAVFALLSALPLLACRKHAATAESAPSASPSAKAEAPVAKAGATVPLATAFSAADLRVEARRGRVAESDAFVVRHRAKLDAHFGGAPRFPLAFQAVAIEGGKFAVLLAAEGREPNPLVWLVDASGEVSWTKERPTGGVKPGVSEMTLTPGPDGHVCLAWCNASTDSVALRRWAEDGAAFADYDALHVDACNALSVLYWPRRGWLLGIAAAQGAVIELINENGERAWGNDGVSLPWTWSGPAPVAFALDTLDTAMLFRLGRSGGDGSAAYVFASRWSPDGRPMWPGPLSVKRLPGPVADSRARVVLVPGAENGVVASLAEGVAGPALAVQVLPDGTVTR
jgi:hypothetical protein